MSRFGSGYVVMIGAALSLGGCGGQIYHPAASSLATSLQAMRPALDSDLADYPNELRAAVLDHAAPNDLVVLRQNPARLLCRPVRSSVEVSAYANKLAAASDSLSDVSGKSPDTFASLAAAALSKYAVTSGQLDPALIAAKAHDECMGDFAFEDAYNGFAVAGGAEAGVAAAFAGLTELWGLVKPIATGVLGFVDQQRRAKAIAAFLQADGKSLKGYVDRIATFSKRKAAYERAVAARTFSNSLTAIGPGPLAEQDKGKILEAAAAYDALRAVDATSAYVAVGDSIQKLTEVSNGKFDRATMSAAIN